MAKHEEVIHLVVYFIIGKYQRVGTVSLTTIFGIPVYKKAGYVKQMLGYTFMSESGLPKTSTKTPMPKVKPPKGTSVPDVPTPNGPLYMRNYGRDLI